MVWISLNPQAGHEQAGRRPALSLAVSGTVLSDHVKSLDWRARRTAFICRLPKHATLEVLHKLATLVAPPP